MKRQRRLPRLLAVCIRWLLIRFGQVFPTLQKRICQCRWLRRLCRLKDEVEQPAKKILESKPLATAHTALWILALTWLVYEALLLLDGNFTVLRLESRLIALGRHHPVVIWLMTDARPIWTILFLTWLREQAHDFFRLRKDPVRANGLIKAWVWILGGTYFLTLMMNQKFNFTHSAQEATVWLICLKLMTYVTQRKSGRRKDDPIDPEPVPSKKVSRAASWINAILRTLLKSGKK